MKKIISSFTLFILLFSCAEIVAPSGGEKDTTPPKVNKSTPENLNTNFNYKKIELKFDEFIKVNSGGGSIIISPSLEKNPKFELIGKKLFINFQEELKEETTYIINFGESIKDNNEGNVLKNYKYIFSTGSYIDSLKIEGKVIDAFTKKPIEDVLVNLYPADIDSILYQKPLYFTKTDKNGFYSLENLKDNKYKIAVLEDKNLNYIFDQENERIAFQDSIINLKENITNKPLLIFPNIKKTKIVNNENKEANHLTFNFNKSFLELKLDIENYQEEEIIYYSLDKKQLHYWYLNKDSNNTEFIITTNKLNTDTFSINLKNNEIKKPFKYTINNQKTEKNNKLILDFPFPIKEFNKDKFSITDNNKEISYNINWLKNNLKLEIKTNTPHDSLIINFSEGCFNSFHNIISTEYIDTIKRFDKQLSSLILNLNQTENLGIELYNEKEELIDVQNVSRETKIVFNNLTQGNYFIRIYRDENKDGIWNSGMFHVKQQPEKTIIYQTVELKDNWDKEIDIKIQ